MEDEIRTLKSIDKTLKEMHVFMKVEIQLIKQLLEEVRK